MAVSLPGPVLTLLRDVMLMKYMNFIAFTMLAYDYILTFSDEVRYIWRREWRAGKVFYIATKYPAFIDSGLFLTFWFDLKLNAQGCRRIFNAGTWFMTAGTIIAEWILCMRTNAIWGKSKKVFVPLVIFVFIGGVYAVKSLQSSLEWSLSPFPTISRCYINVTRPNLLYTVYVCTMGKEFVIFALTLWKGVSQWKTSRSPLINTLYRDGVLYFFIMFAISLTNFVMAIVGPKVRYTGYS
ncbi:hypothetical protein SCHPADRAFT_424337 [Schizopora paradoxa]|uniref:DUF6533 domain-containing protein n=1 Tax=Schizopora paradoxa TaxID=27342 RepID=A0A0H2RKB0_9AGAM|nr:hypothetical protein SCHPADRAFT_424337 [Schizopora paradoxa]